MSLRKHEEFLKVRMFPEGKSFYKFGPFRLDLDTCDLWIGGQLVALEPKVADTLLVLVRSQGKVVEKGILVRQVWGAVPVSDSSLARNISVLRRNLAKYLDGQDCIETVPTRGYRFLLPVTEHCAQESLTSPVFACGGVCALP